MALFEPIVTALNEAKVRYVVVGGVAVVLHGHAGLTADLDLAVDLTPGAAANAVDTLVGQGLRPRAPVEPSEFAQPEARARWMAEHGMQVFSMWDPDDPMRSVDLFVDNPIDFEELWRRSEIVPLGNTTARVASIPDLIRLKRIAAGPRTSSTSRRSRRSSGARRAMGDRTRAERDEWNASWAAHRREQRRRVLMATPAQRLAALEEMIELAHRTGALPRRTSPWGHRR